MKYYILSDLHIDFYEAYAVKPARYKMADPAEDVTIDTLEYIWNTHFLPEADAIISLLFFQENFEVESQQQGYQMPDSFSPNSIEIRKLPNFSREF